MTGASGYRNGDNGIRSNITHGRIAVAKLYSNSESSEFTFTYLAVSARNFGSMANSISVRSL